MNVDLTIIHLVTNASFLVQLVMLALLGLSLVSWTIIFQRGAVLSKFNRNISEFEDGFWSGIELGKLYEKVVAKRDNAKGIEKIFLSGFREFARLKKQGAEVNAIMNGTERAMRVELAKEQSKLQQQLAFLATVGSISPYVGLFGTVWGIMNSFRALGNVEQATLAMVAPGISEALIATAMGLFAAIPAVIAYNRYANKAQGILDRCDTFMEEFINLLHRKALS